VTAIRLTHIGGPTVLIEAQGWRVLTDPTFDAPGQTYTFGWGSKSTKLSGPALGSDDVGPVDVVLLSHDQHGDNLDDAGRVLLATTPTVITTKVGARRLGGGVRGLDPWEVTRLDAAGKPTLEVTATP
jgi:L-ascorbate metabolism protein UlaG (beta-lactamase superfamily)